MEREQHALLVGVFDLLFEEWAQGAAAHEGGVDDFAGLKREFGFEHRGLAVLADELDPRVGGIGDRHRLLIGPEISPSHMGDMGL